MCIICNLLKEAKAHNQDSLAEIISRFSPLIRKYSYSLNYEDAESDLVVSMIQLIYDMPVFNNDGQAVQYISKSMNHAYIKLLKGLIQRRENEILYDPDTFKNLQRLSESGDEKDLDILSALEQLTHNQKWVIKYKFFYMLPDKEIMKRLNISRQAVYKNKINALKKLREILEQ